jgi:hypothetical protein
VDSLHDPCALVGLMPDGSVVAAFLGPRGGVGDDKITERIGRRFERALRAAGIEHVRESLASLTVAHCWSDEIFDVPSLVLDHASAGHNGAGFGDRNRPELRKPA